MAIERRTYANSENARAALDELLLQGFSEFRASFRWERAHLAVTAPGDDEAQRVAGILDRHGPLPDGDWDDEADAGRASPLFDFGKAWNSTTPLSDFFGWSVLSSYRSPFWPAALLADPTPLSNKFGWAVLYGASQETVRRIGASPAPLRIAPPTDSPRSSALVAVAAETPAGEKAEPPRPEPTAEPKRARRTTRSKDKDKDKDKA